LITFLFPEIVISINEFVHILLSRIVVSGVLYGMVMSVLSYYYYYYTEDFTLMYYFLCLFRFKM